MNKLTQIIVAPFALIVALLTVCIAALAPAFGIHFCIDEAIAIFAIVPSAGLLTRKLHTQWVGWRLSRGVGHDCHAGQEHESHDQSTVPNTGN